MLRPERREYYRRMSNAERLALTLKLIEENTPYRFSGSPEDVARRFELIRRQNGERHTQMLEGMARYPPLTMTSLNDALRDMLALFQRLQIPYAIVGGLAVRVYGIPRPTQDVDFTIAIAQ